MLNATSHSTPAALAGLFLATAFAPAETIFSEDFSGPPETDLNGLAPDIRPGSETWTATPGAWQADGSNLSDGDYSAFLDFTPVEGKVYTLSATVTQPDSPEGSQWIALGFTSTNTATGPSGAGDPQSFWSNGASPWMLYRPTGDVVFFTGPGVDGTSTPVATLSGPQTFSLVLDTSGSQWTAEVLAGETSLFTHTFEPGGNPSINHVGFGRENGAATSISAFQLINGAGSAGPPIVEISPNGETLGNYDFTWNSSEGKTYRLVSSTDLSTEPSTWTVWDDQLEIAATEPRNTLPDIPGGGDKRFFAIVEND